MLGTFGARGPDFTRAAGSFLLLLSIVFLAGAAYRAARESTGPRRVFFCGFAISAVFSTLAQSHNFVRYVVMGEVPSFPSPGLLVLLLGSHPALLLGLGAALGWRRRALRADVAIDTLLLVTAAAVVGIQLGYLSPWPVQGFTDPARVLLLLWRGMPVAELCLTILLVATLGASFGRRTSLGLVLGMLAFTAANLFHGRLALTDQAAAVSSTDVVWALANLGFAAALRGRPGAVAGPDGGAALATGQAGLRARFIAAAIVIVAQATLFLGLREERNAPLAIAVALFVLLLALRAVRELLGTRRRTASLTHTIAAERALSQSLEASVQERTTELAEAQRVLQRMWVLGQHVTRELQPDRVVQCFMEAVTDVARVDGVALGLVVDERYLRLASVVGSSHQLTGRLVEMEGSLMGRVVRTGRVHQAVDVAIDPTLALVNPLLRTMHVRPDGSRGGGLAVIPVQRGGECIGAIALVSHAPRDWRPEELARIEAMTDLLSVALANAEAVESLRQAEWRFRTLFRAAPDAVLTLLPGGRIREANDFAAELFATPSAALAGRTLGELVLPDDRAALADALAAGFRDRPARVDVRVPREGGLRQVEIALRRLPDSEPSTVLLIGRDITHEKVMQARLLEAERLAAVGELVAGVAHEVNNPLSSISAFAQLLMRDGDLSEEQRESVEVVHSEALRASQVVKDLLAFARRSEPRREPVDLGQAVERALRLRGYQLSTRHVRTVLELDPELPPVLADMRQLQQVVLNLVTNALQAMPDGGTLTLVTRRRGEQVELEIADTGTGIAEDARPHIFEPFFTTKGEGEGTGLGLSVSYGIVAAHGGSLDLVSTGPEGTRFLVTLPAADDEAAGGDTSCAPSPAGRRSRLAGMRILFVDDEAALRQGMETFGRRRGVGVVTAPDGAAALRAVETTSFDAVVCDLRMPEMDGRAFLEALRERRPGLAARTIFVTGDVVGGASFDDARLPLHAPASGPVTLGKPFTFEQLEEAVLTVLRGGVGARV
ncbi:MAG TPA: ATP-binding protein [Gemmatimonadaceae bacterium]|nr:ATP-binding protein [Gemmatimonadaceae bacterium]